MSCLISKMLKKYLQFRKISRNSHAGSILEPNSEAQHLGVLERLMASFAEGIIGSTCPFCFQFGVALATLFLVNEGAWAGCKTIETRHLRLPPLAQGEHGYLQLAGR